MPAAVDAGYYILTNAGTVIAPNETPPLDELG
jgi:hypothetical protein